MKDFRVVPTKPWFTVSSDGKIVKWTETGKIICPYEDKDGYLRVNYKGKHAGVHVLVALAFCENPKPKEFTIVNHLDSDKRNNHYSNLEWTSYKLNRMHRINSGFLENACGEKHHFCTVLNEEKVREVCELLELGMRTVDIVNKTGVSRGNVNNLKRGKSWQHITCEYSFRVTRKETISKGTLDWVKDQIDRGRSFEEILAIAKRLDYDTLARAIELLKVV